MYTKCQHSFLLHHHTIYISEKNTSFFLFYLLVYSEHSIPTHPTFPHPPFLLLYLAVLELILVWPSNFYFAFEPFCYLWGCEQEFHFSASSLVREGIFCSFFPKNFPLPIPPTTTRRKKIIVCLPFIRHPHLIESNLINKRDMNNIPK